MLNMRGFISNLESKYTIKCKEKAILINLDFKKFMDLIKGYPLDFEKYKEMHDNYNFNDIKVGKKCSNCQKFSHDVTTCPNLHYTIYKNNFIAK